MSEPSTEPHSPAPAPLLSTRDRIIQTAEQLFARHGLDGVSIRDITNQAGANVGAVNYYFGSKDGLVLALFERRLAPITAERLTALDRLEKDLPHRIPAAEDVILAFIHPVVQHALDPQWGDTSFARLIGRLIGECGPVIEQLKKVHFDPIIERYDAALMRAIPSLSEAELRRRMNYVVGAMHYMLMVFDDSFPCKVDKNPDPEEQVQRLVKFAVAGLRA